MGPVFTHFARLSHEFATWITPFGTELECLLAAAHMQVVLHSYTTRYQQLDRITFSSAADSTDSSRGGGANCWCTACATPGSRRLAASPAAAAARRTRATTPSCGGGGARSLIFGHTETDLCTFSLGERVFRACCSGARQSLPHDYATPTQTPIYNIQRAVCTV